MTYPRIKLNRYVDANGVPNLHTGKHHAEDLHDFHLPLPQVQNANLFTWGVVCGLEVSGTLGTGTDVTIQPGVAIDVQGRLLVLADDGFGDIGVDPANGQHNEVATPVTLGFGTNTGAVYVTIQYAEILRSNEGASGRLELVPWLRLQPVAGFVADGIALILAVVEIDNTGQLTALSERSNNTLMRRVIGQTGQGIELRRAATVDAQVKEVSSAKLVAGADGGLQLTVPNPTDTILLACENGEQFATLDVFADNVHTQGNLQVDGALRVTGTTALGGNLGIGTPTPSQALTIQGAADTHLNVRANDGSQELLLGTGTTGGVLATTTNHALHLGAGGANPMLTIQPEGKVGIGTANPSQALEINGAVKATDFIKGATPLVSSQWTDIAGGINYAGGKVGIGTATPAGKLDVAGVVRLGLDEGGSGTRTIAFSRDVGDEINAGKIAYRPSWHPDALGIIGAGTTGVARKIHMWDDVCINGRLGVAGVVNPIRALQIGASIDAAFTFENGQDPDAGFIRFGDHTGWKLHFGRSHERSMANPNTPLNTGTTGVLMTIKDNGNVGIGTTNPQHPLHMGAGAFCEGGLKWKDGSSIEYKEEVVTLSLATALETLAGLNPVTYKYKEDVDGDTHVGFIAEEVPQLVASKDRKGLGALDIVSILTKVVQHQQQQIAALQALLK